MQTYDPKDIIITYGGTILSGFSEDVVTVERAEDQVTDEIGADGEVVRILSNDRRGNIRIFLLPTSPSNLVLSVVANLDELTGAGVKAILVQDNRGNDLHTAAECWIQKQPETIYNKTASPRVWNLRCGDLRMVVGGHLVAA